VCHVRLREEWRNAFLNLKDRNYVIEIDEEENLLLNRIIKQICEKDHNACSGELNSDFC
jgi:hypothetical protein